jgi:putative cardiolipin synthase
MVCKVFASRVAFGSAIGHLASDRHRQEGKAGGVLQWLLMVAGVVLALYAALRWTFCLPRKPAEPAPAASDPPPDTTLSRFFATHGAAAAGGSAVHPLAHGKSAFAARMMLIDLAEHSIDVQYYIWRRDLTGLLLLDRLRAAAERGVKVRLLLDDNGIAGLDPLLAELDAHPAVSVRLYNPFVIRRPRLVNYAFDFVRLNRRMHNKAMTFDGVLTLTGGRNIGDEYFDTGENPLFVDLDVIASGAAAAAVAEDFGRYWRSRSAYDLARIVKTPPVPGGLAAAVAALQASPALRGYAEDLADDPVTADLVAGRVALQPARATLVSDAPDKTLGSVLKGELITDQLTSLLGRVERRLDLVSPYFVPGRRGVAQFGQLARRGAKLRVLTNSLEANDVALVHAGYRKYRRRLLESGVELLELKARPGVSTAPALPDRTDERRRLGTSSASLHAKTFGADGTIIFIGSFNFDPRSVWLNTEMGLLIESPVLASGLHAMMDEHLAALAYRVRLDPAGRMVWEDPQTGAVLRHDPHSRPLQRAMIRIAGWLPIEWLL